MEGVEGGNFLRPLDRVKFFVANDVLGSVSAISVSDRLRVIIHSGFVGWVLRNPKYSYLDESIGSICHDLNETD